MIVLTAMDVERLLSLDALIPAIEDAHREHASGGATTPTPLLLASASTDTHVLAMAASSARLGMSAVKTMTDTPSNARRDLDTQRSTILVIDDADGTPVALIDGVSVTKLRTAATSAVATDWLARKDAHSLALLGAGALAPLHARAISRVREVTEVVIWNRSPARAERVAALLRSEGMPARVEDHAERAVRGADIVCTLTPSAAPVLLGAWLEPGQHLNAVGAPPRADHREVDGEAMARAELVVDSLPNSLAKSGDALMAIADGWITPDDLSTELGEVIDGAKTGRSHDSAITLFNSLGMGLQDLAAAELLYRTARDDDAVRSLFLRA